MWSLIFLTLLTLSTATHWEDFIKFIKIHDRVYQTKELFEHKFKIFTENMIYAKKMNELQIPNKHPVPTGYIIDMQIRVKKKYKAFAYNH